MIYPDKQGGFTYSRFHFDNLQPPISLREEIRGSRESYAGSSDETPPKGTVLANTLSERTSLRWNFVTIEYMRVY